MPETYVDYSSRIDPYGLLVYSYEYTFNLIALASERMSKLEQVKTLLKRVEFVSFYEQIPDILEPYENEIVLQYLNQYGDIKIYKTKEEQFKIYIDTTKLEIERDLFFTNCILILPTLLTDVWVNGLTERELEILELISKREVFSVVNIVTNFLDQFKSELQRKILENYKGKTVESLILSKVKEVESKQADINYYRGYINDLVIEINQLNREIAGLEFQKGTDNNKPLFDFILAHENIEVRNATANSIYLRVRDVLEFDDPDRFWVIYNNEYSNFRESLSNDTDILYVLKKVCGERLGNINFMSDFKFENMENMYIEVWSSEDATHLYNPHLKYHRCLGDNENPVYDALYKGIYETAIERLIAATKNMNWDEWTTIQYFIDDIKKAKRNGMRVIHTLEGNDLTIKEAYNYFKELEEEKNE